MFIRINDVLLKPSLYFNRYMSHAVNITGIKYVKLGEIRKLGK